MNGWTRTGKGADRKKEEGQKREPQTEPHPGHVLRLHEQDGCIISVLSGLLQYMEIQHFTRMASDDETTVIQAHDYCHYSPPLKFAHR